jgi:hypothetical protein
VLFRERDGREVDFVRADAIRSGVLDRAAHLVVQSHVARVSCSDRERVEHVAVLRRDELKRSRLVEADRVLREPERQDFGVRARARAVAIGDEELERRVHVLARAGELELHQETRLRDERRREVARLDEVLHLREAHLSLDTVLTSRVHASGQKERKGSELGEVHGVATSNAHAGIFFPYFQRAG